MTKPRHQKVASPTRSHLVRVVLWLLLASGLTLAGVILLSVGLPDPLYGIAVGIFAALPASLTFIHELALSSPSARVKTLVTLSLLSFIISFVLFAWMEASAIRVSVVTSNLLLHPSIENGKIEVKPRPGVDYLPPGAEQELWVRFMVPPSLGKPCYTADPLVCSSVSAALATFERSQSDWGWALTQAGTSFISLLTTGLLARNFTRG
jgi:hypothetical protein